MREAGCFGTCRAVTPHRLTCSQENGKNLIGLFYVCVFDSSVFAEHSLMFSLDLFPVLATGLCGLVR